MKLPRGVVVLIALGLAGAVLCVVGFALAGGADERIAAYPAVEAGSETTLDLEGGRQIGWYESTCFGCKGRESVSPAPELRIEGPGDSSAGPVPVQPYGDDRSARYSPGDFLNYSDGAWDGGPAYEIDVPENGSYLVAVGASSEPDARIRIGPSTEARKVTGIALAVGGFLLAGGALFVLAAWWIAVMLKRATENG